ncbi:hypothetical protein FD754_025695, partial [Muntiacus muntjak]
MPLLSLSGNPLRARTGVHWGERDRSRPVTHGGKGQANLEHKETKVVAWSPHSIDVTLGAHNIKERERTQEFIPVRTAFPHPRYNMTGVNDIMLLQLMKKAKVTTAVSPISLPRDRDTVNPGMLCSVAGWGRLGLDMSHPQKLQEVELEVQRAKKCTSRYKHYRTTTQICAGDAREKKSSFRPW